MRKQPIVIMLAVMLVFGWAWVARGQNKDKRCEVGDLHPRNWIQVEGSYIYFLYELCPPDVNPPTALVKLLVTTSTKEILVEKWMRDRDGADVVTMVVDKKKAYTLYRDLKAVPDRFIKQERRSGVPAETAAKPMMLEGSYLVLFQNLTPESADNVTKIFQNADLLIKKAEAKGSLLFDAPRITALVAAMEVKPKQK